MSVIRPSTFSSLTDRRNKLSLMPSEFGVAAGRMLVHHVSPDWASGSALQPAETIASGSSALLLDSFDIRAMRPY
jgi:hypothetical protein